MFLKCFDQIVDLQKCLFTKINVFIKLIWIIIVANQSLRINIFANRLAPSINVSALEHLNLNFFKFKTKNNNNNRLQKHLKLDHIQSA